MVTPDEKTDFSGVHPLGIMNDCTKIWANTCNRSWDTKLVGLEEKSEARLNKNTKAAQAQIWGYKQEILKRISTPKNEHSVIISSPLVDGKTSGVLWSTRHFCSFTAGRRCILLLNNWRRGLVLQCMLVQHNPRLKKKIWKYVFYTIFKAKIFTSLLTCLKWVYQLNHKGLSFQITLEITRCSANLHDGAIFPPLLHFPSAFLILSSHFPSSIYVELHRAATPLVSFFHFD